MRISVIIPCRNEERTISNCIRSVLDFELQSDTEIIEILIIDGRSTDKTREIIQEFILRNNKIQLIDNPFAYQMYALNIGIKLANGERILRIDAHCFYPNDYLYNLILTANRTDAENIGGICNTVPYDNSYNASLVQALTTSFFGVGNSGFRIGAGEGKTDTVPYGFFKKEVFNKIGNFDERLQRGEDYEFNRRITKNGGTVWLNPEIKVDYLNQPSLYKLIEKQFLKEGPFNAYMWFLHPYTLAYRHFIPALFATGIIAGLFLSLFIPIIKYIYISVLVFYILVAISASVRQAIRYKRKIHILLLPFSFFFFHFFYGLGIIIGAVKLLLNISPVQKYLIN